MHSAALSIFRRLGASIEEQGGDAYKSKSLKMETIKTIVKQFMTDGECVCLYFFITCWLKIFYCFIKFFWLTPLILLLFSYFFFLLLETGDRGSLLLRSTEASDFQEDVQVYLRKLENEGMYASTKRRLKNQTKK